MVHLDEADRAIVLELQRDSRLTYAEIGTRVGLSAASAHDRVKKLERKGVILGYGARVNAKRLGLEVIAFIAVRLENATSRDVAPLLETFTEIEECHSVAGEVDLMLKVRTSTPEDLEFFIYRLKQVAGVARTSTSITLSTYFEDRILQPSLPDESVEP